MRNNLASLQLISLLQARTTQRLSTGMRVNTAVDDPQAYFAAAGHRSRATDLAARKDSMGEALQTVQAATTGVDGITKLIEQAKGLVASARSAGATERGTLATQFDDLLDQIDSLAGDSSYKGVNLLSSGTLTVDFNEDASSSLTITGFDASSTGLAVATSANAWVADGDIDAAAADLDAALTTLRSQAKTLATSTGIVQARQEFTNSLITTLTTGADNLTAADPNEESANMLALQTRQQLGVAALGLANQAQQSILRLF